MLLCSIAPHQLLSLLSFFELQCFVFIFLNVLLERIVKHCDCLLFSFFFLKIQICQWARAPPQQKRLRYWGVEWLQPAATPFLCRACPNDFSWRSATCCGGRSRHGQPTPIHLDFLHRFRRFITLHWIQVVMVNVSPGSGEWVPSRQVAIYNRATIQLLWKLFQTACRSYVRVSPRGLRGWSFPDFHHPSILFIIYMIFSISFHHLLHLLIIFCPYSFTSPFTIIVLSFHIVSYHFIYMSYTSRIHFIYISYALHSMYVSCTFHTFQDVIVFHDPFIILLYSFRHPFITLLTPFKVDSSLWGFHYHVILFHFYQQSRISSFLEKFLVAGTLPTKLFLRNWRIWSFGGRFCFVCSLQL